MDFARPQLDRFLEIGALAFSLRICLVLAMPAALALAQALPTLPLWIAPDFSVPLDLEASYQMTCADLRIRQAG